jgi:hypothetical protein
MKEAKKKELLKVNDELWVMVKGKRWIMENGN